MAVKVLPLISAPPSITMSLVSEVAKKCLCLQQNEGLFHNFQMKKAKKGAYVSKRCTFSLALGVPDCDNATNGGTAPS